MSLNENNDTKLIINKNFTKEIATQPLWSNDRYIIKFLEFFPTKLVYFNSDDQYLPDFLSTIKIKPFLILQPHEHKSNETFRFSIINTEFCLIVSVFTEIPPFFLYNFIKIIRSSVVLFPDQQLKEEFENFFQTSFPHFQYYNDDLIIRNFINYFKENRASKSFFDYKIQEDPRIRYTLYETICQTADGILASFVARHNFFQYKIKINHFPDFSKDYQILKTFYSSDTYQIHVVFHSACDMLFIYKYFIGKNSSNNAFIEKRYIDNHIFNSIIRILGLFQYKSGDNDENYALVYEYTPLYQLTDKSLSRKTVDNCLINLLKELDKIHESEYVVNNLFVDTVLFSVDNSIFFCNYHEFSKASSGFENDLYDFGSFLQTVKCNNKYLNELVKCYEQSKKLSSEYLPCFPVTQYFIYRTGAFDGDFHFNLNRKDNKTLFEENKRKSIGVLKTLMFCYASSSNITQLLNEFPKENKDHLISIGEEMLDFNKEKGLEIFECIIKSDSCSQLVKEKVHYIIGRYYFMQKEYEKTEENFSKIEKDGKIFYIIGRMYQKNFFTESVEKNTIYSKYFKKATEFNYWRAFYQEGLREMEEGNFESAINNFNQAKSVKDNDGDEELFGLLGDDYDYLSGMIYYNIALCYKKVSNYEKMVSNFEVAIGTQYNCKLAFAPLSYIYFRNNNYEKSFEILQEASNFLPLNFNLIVNTNVNLICRMIDGDRPDLARKYLNLAIKLYANSQMCDEKSKNFLIKNIQKYSAIIANKFNDKGKIADAFPCYALSAAFGFHAGFIGLAKAYYYGYAVSISILNTLICLKYFFYFYPVGEKGNDYIDTVDELISKYPVFMQRKSYFEIGSILFRVSRSPYIPFDFLIRASYLTLPEIFISDIKFATKFEERARIVVESILNHYQYTIPETNNTDQSDSLSIQHDEYD